MSYSLDRPHEELQQLLDDVSASKEAGARPQLDWRKEREHWMYVKIMGDHLHVFHSGQGYYLCPAAGRDPFYIADGDTARLFAEEVIRRDTVRLHPRKT